MGLGGTNLYESRFSSKTILAIGSEAHGVSNALQQRATQKITIPLQTECESLNAAVAGSICIFHITRSTPVMIRTIFTCNQPKYIT
ncbi:MAG: hypothetical protein JXR40_09700 [Pontiellaceae bacterium]|nr:hypothetical protein [Pontiellaceae bacterium]